MQAIVVPNPYASAFTPPANGAPPHAGGNTAGYAGGVVQPAGALRPRPIEGKTVWGCPVDCLTACALLVATIAITAACIAWGYVDNLNKKLGDLEATVAKLAPSPTPMLL